MSVSNLQRAEGILAVRADGRRNSRIIMGSGARADLSQDDIARLVDSDDPASYMRGLSVAFSDFRERHDGRIDTLEHALEHQSEVINALRIGGGSGDASAGFSDQRISRLPPDVSSDFRNVMRGLPSATMTRMPLGSTDSG